MAISEFTLVLSVLNFAGSVSSSIGSGFIILCYLILPLRRHFRHVLILNLAVADFINATNISVSGSLILIRGKPLSQSPACVFNGFVTQLSVQGTDTAILAITLITVYTITRSSPSRGIQAVWSTRAILLTTAAIWSLPLITSFLALGKGWYGPVSGNWCWLVSKPIYLRYVLTHGWRYLFMIIEISLVIYLHVFLRRHFRTLRIPVVSSVAAPSVARKSFTPMTFTPSYPSEDSKQSIVAHNTDDAGLESQATGQDSVTALPKSSTISVQPCSEDDSEGSSPSHVHSDPNPSVPTEHPRYKAIQRILLLNAYPLFYIILWIPGLANRMVEASGHSSRVTQIMQASTQFVGLANAITYGWNERIARELRRKYWG